MRLKKEFDNFYKTIRIDSESTAFRETREALKSDVEDKFPEILIRISLNK